MNLSEPALKVLKTRYLVKDDNGRVIETPEELFMRVSRAVAEAVKLYPKEADTYDQTVDDFNTMLTNLDFLPNSPTLMNAGRPLGQLAGCFVLPIENDVEQILKIVLHTALIHKSGGGTGFNFTKADMPAPLAKWTCTFTIRNDHPDLEMIKALKLKHAKLKIIDPMATIRQVHIVEDTMESLCDLSVLIDRPSTIDFSDIRPCDSIVKSTNGKASGPASFIKVWDQAIGFLTNYITPITTIELFNEVTEAVKQGGVRRGANMGIVNVRSKYIKEFITCKKDNASINNFNISVGADHAFMEEIDENYEALALFNMIVDGAHKNGEPGIIFLDQINEMDPIENEEIEATNPCGETPLLKYEACNLGSINLYNMVDTVNGVSRFNYVRLERTVRLAVKFLDNVIDINKYPLKEVEDKVKLYRRIGLGVMGWADTLCKLGIAYNSNEGIELGRTISNRINKVAFLASQDLAETRGNFPGIKNTIYKNTVLRNATRTVIAPTGTLSLIANVSSGIEPLFGIVTIKNVMDGQELILVNRPFLDAYATLFPKKQMYEHHMKFIAEVASLKEVEFLSNEIKKAFPTTHDVTPEYHVMMQAAWQENTDSAVSKTINLSSTATKQDIINAYKLACKLSCKGITVYVDQSRDAQVLNIGKVNKKAPEVKQAPPEIKHTVPEDTTPKEIAPRPRPEYAYGFTQKISIGCGNLYVTCNWDEHGICEIFTNTGRAGGCPSQSEATSRLVSTMLRANMPINIIIDQLKGIRCPSTTRQKGHKVTSCPDAIGKVLEKAIEMRKALLFDPEEVDLTSPTQEELIQNNCEQSCSVCTMYDACNAPKEPKAPSMAPKTSWQCPECGNIIEHEGGCVICKGCGYSKCG